MYLYERVDRNVTFSRLPLPFYTFVLNVCPLLDCPKAEKLQNPIQIMKTNISIKCDGNTIYSFIDWELPFQWNDAIA